MKERLSTNVPHYRPGKHLLVHPKRCDGGFAIVTTEADEPHPSRRLVMLYAEGARSGGTGLGLVFCRQSGPADVIELVMHQLEPIRRFGPNLVNEYELHAEEYDCFWHFSLRFRGRDSSIPRKVRVYTSGNVVPIDRFGSPLDGEQRDAVFKALKNWSRSEL